MGYKQNKQDEFCLLLIKKEILESALQIPSSSKVQASHSLSVGLALTSLKHLLALTTEGGDKTFLGIHPDTFDFL